MDAASLSSRPDAERDESRKLLLELYEEVHALERRVAVLEQHGVAIAPHGLPEALPVPELKVSADTVPALGRALLAVAGAYLLRALTEMGVLPHAAGVAAGIAYAALWLWLASRSRRDFTAALNAATAIIVLAPLLWEAVVRLHATPPWVAAVTLAAFPIAAVAFERKANTAMVSSIVAPACAWTSLVLIFGTQAMLPFTLASLAIAAACEIDGTRTRWMVAIAADCEVLLLVGLTGRSAGLPEGYAPVPIVAAAVLAALLAAIYVGEALHSTVLQQRPFSIFGIVQTAGAFVIGVGGVWYLTHASAAIACVMLAAGVGCYAIAGRATHARNLYTYATFAFLLTAGAIPVLASGWALTVIWPALAIVVFFVNPGKLGNWHAAAFLWLAAVFAPHSFVGVVPAAVAVYALLIRRRDERSTAFLIGGAVVYSIASALLTSVHRAGVPTASLTLCSIGLAAAGARLRRPELVWLMFATMATAGWQLVTHDLEAESSMPLVFSLLLFGGTLVLLPKILKSAGR